MRFYTSGLLSKWGFIDGGLLDDMLYGLLESREISLRQLDAVDSRKLLCWAVENYVLPKIKSDVGIVFRATSHNPVRADRVNGMDVDWFSENEFEIEPAFVDVDDRIILAKAVELANSAV